MAGDLKLVKKPEEMQKLAEAWRREGKVIGFVPTMGALHEGHLSLIRIARERADVVVVSIFVNPTQFGPGEDYERYPRDLEGDLAKCREEGVDVVFAPEVRDMYPEGFSTFVEVQGLTEELCGKYRPGHFRGVTTVVAKLFNIVKPHFAVFGLKDAQQFFVIRRMVRDLNFDIEIVPGQTVREPDGLAMSSRNAYLSPEERRQAPALYRALLLARDMVLKEGVRDPEVVKEAVRRFIEREAPLARLQYVEVVDTERIKPVKEIKGEVLIALAAFFGKARLIDNVILKVD